MIKNEVKIGKALEVFNGRNITFSVTEDCNLDCKYCYMTKKNNKKKMSFEVAKKAVDFVLNNREEFNDEAVIWDFIGGEPFLEIDLIDKITDYFKIQMYKLNHPWFNNFRISFSSNGLLYKSEKVQRYIKKNKKNLSIGLSIDGNKIKHDSQRVKLDGSGSFDDVVDNAKLWVKQFPDASTKATFSSGDIKYLKDSVIELWNMGIKQVSANVVFEDVWKEGDDIVYENQLKALADYVLENRLSDQYSVRFFDYTIGFPVDEKEKNKNFCGAGKMLAIDCEGNFFPCIRFLDLSLTNQKGRIMGNIDTGIDKNVVRAFEVLDLKSQSSKECINCPVGSGCAWCSGFNYDDSQTGTIFERAKHHCKMHKANVRACEYFWRRYSEVTGLMSPREEYRLKKKNKKYMMFITSDDITPHCNYESNSSSDVVMSENLFNKGMDFAKENDYVPFILTSERGSVIDYDEFFNFVPRSAISRANAKSLVISKIDESSHREEFLRCNNIIASIDRENIEMFSDFILDLYGQVKRVNVVIQDIECWNDLDLQKYRLQLNVISESIKNKFDVRNRTEINILTELLNINKMNNCGAGENTFALAPNGKIYLCPAFYFENPENFVGDLDKGIYKLDQESYDINNSPICSECDAYHCKRCKYLNEKLTKEMRVPSKVQCEVSHIEREVSQELQQQLMDQELSFKNIIQRIDYVDPLVKILRRKEG